MDTYSLSFEHRRTACSGIALWLSALAITCAAITGEFAGAQPVNPDIVTIRGLQFNLGRLETATRDDLRRMGIDPGGLAGVPQDDGIPHWRILKFERPVDRSLRRRLRAEGLRLDYYVSGAYLEHITLAKVKFLKRTQLLRVSAPYFPEFKLAPSLRGARLHEDREFQTEARRQIDGLLLRATAFRDQDLNGIAAELRTAGALDIVLQHGRRSGAPDRILFRLTLGPAELEQAMLAVSRIDGLQSIEEVGEVVPLNAVAAAFNQSGDTGNASLWNLGLTGEGQAISVIDVGIADIDHCLFADPSIPDNVPGTDHRKVWEVRDQSGASTYDPAHATYVSASAAGDHFDATGIHAQRGGAWGAGLVLINVADFGTELNPPSDLPTELSAAALRAHVHSNSWHYPYGGYSEFAYDFDNFAYLNEMHLVVAAAGHANGTWAPPAISKNVLTVSALDPETSQVCSVYGSYPSSQRQKPDLAAVGRGYQSAKPGGSNCEFVGCTCATSYATPHAAAMAILARQYFVEEHHPGAPDPSGSLIKATLINSAQDMADVEGFPNEREGWGALTLDKTLRFGPDVADLWVRDILNADEGALDSGEQHEYLINVASAGQPLKVTLAWNDPPGTLGSDALINHLDLDVQAPDDGPLFLGNEFDAATGESAPGGNPDDINNVEQVLVTAPALGQWRLRVKAGEIAVVDDKFSGQGYALVVTAGLSGIGVPSPIRDLSIASSHRNEVHRKTDKKAAESQAAPAH